MSKFINYVITKEYVRWDDIIKRFDYEGDEEFAIDEYNVVLWRGISKEFKDDLEKEWRHGRIIFVPTELITYQLGGIPVNEGYAIGKSIPENGYKDKKWFPTLITYKVR